MKSNNTEKRGMVQAEIHQLEEEKGKSNRNGKPMCMDEMDNNREEAELWRDLEDGTTPYPVPLKISVWPAAIANQPTQV